MRCVSDAFYVIFVWSFCLCILFQISHVWVPVQLGCSLKVRSHLPLFNTFLEVKSSHFNRNSCNLELHARLKGFPDAYFASSTESCLKMTSVLHTSLHNRQRIIFSPWNCSKISLILPPRVSLDPFYWGTSSSERTL